MEIVKLKLSQIKPYENNPRRNDQAVDAVVESIKQCGYCSPILVDENHVILAGHTRYKALQKLGWKEAEVVVRAGLTDEQKRKYRLLDNKTNEFATWDWELLDKELEGLDFSGFDFGFNFGFSGSGGSFQTVTAPESEYENAPSDEGFEDYQNPLSKEELEEYAENSDEYLARRRVIITFTDEQEDTIKDFLRVKSEDKLKILYKIEEILGEW